MCKMLGGVILEAFVIWKMYKLTISLRGAALVAIQIKKKHSEKSDIRARQMWGLISSVNFSGYRFQNVEGCNQNASFCES